MVVTNTVLVQGKAPFLKQLLGKFQQYSLLSHTVRISRLFETMLLWPHLITIICTSQLNL